MHQGGGAGVGIRWYKIHYGLVIASWGPDMSVDMVAVRNCKHGSYQAEFLDADLRRFQAKT